MDRHYWYYRFKADTAWLDDFIEDIERTDRALVLTLTGQTGVGFGFDVTEKAGGQNFSVDISAGRGYDDTGKHFYSGGTINVPFITDEAGNPITVTGNGNARIVSIYAGYALVEDPASSVVDGFGATVFTIATEAVSFKLYQGAEAAAGAETAPADPGLNLVRIADVTIRKNDLTIANADVNNNVKEYLTLTNANNSIKDFMIDWGTGANQVSAADVPIADGGNYFTATQVEAALQETQDGTAKTTFKIDRLGPNPLTFSLAVFTAARTVVFPDAAGNIPVLPTSATTETGTGAVVRTNSPTLVTPTIASLTNMQHNHQNAAGGGSLDAAALGSGTLANARVAQSNVTQHQGALALDASQITTGTLANGRVAQSNVTQHQAALSLDATQLTAGTLPNARVAQGNVTQHQAALSIAESQIPDGAILARVGGNETISGSWTFSNEIALPSTSIPTANKLSQKSTLKAWCCYDPVNQIVKNHFNCSSVTYQGVGYYTFNWNVAFANSNYPVDHSGQYACDTFIWARTTTTLDLYQFDTNNGAWANGSNFGSSHVDVKAGGDQ